MKNPVIKVLFLAAGSATRFGADKRQCEVQPGVSLLQLSVQPFLQAQMDVCIALSARDTDEALERLIRGWGLEALRCAKAEEGMGATLAEAALHLRDADVLCIALADMPLMNHRTLRALQNYVSRQSIVYPCYQDRRGHPVFFGSDFFPDLFRLDGDRGAAALLSTEAESCQAVAVDDPGVIFDVDTPERIEELRCALQRFPES
jgi:molybdenum cofactor cytidylyltransferase